MLLRSVDIHLPNCTVSQPTNQNLCNKSNVIQSYKRGGGFSAVAAKLSTDVIFGLGQVVKTLVLRIIRTVTGIGELKGNFSFIF